MTLLHSATAHVDWGSAKIAPAPSTSGVNATFAASPGATQVPK